MPPIPGINKTEINQIMNDAEIQQVAIASGSDKDHIDLMTLPEHQKKESVFGAASLWNTENREKESTFGTASLWNSKNTEKESTVGAASLWNSKNTEKESTFGAASLSKPVFTYLVLKLLNKTDFTLDTKLNDSILSFKDFCAKFKIIWEDTPENKARVNQITPGMILSHQTGLPIGYKFEEKQPIKFEFEPNTGFGYTGISLMYLQEWMQLKFKKTLEELVKEYVFTPAGMERSTFEYNGREANAANSLHTTASDYVRFCIHWMNDPDPNVQQAFVSKVELREDPWAKRRKVSADVLDHLSWGYGFGLERRSDGKWIAYHTGDANEWRAGVQLDLETKTAKVFFSNSTYQNGHLLQEPIFGKSNALEWFFDKYAFARKVDELPDDWREIRSFGERKKSIEHTYEPAKELQQSTTEQQQSTTTSTSSNPFSTNLTRK